MVKHTHALLPLAYRLQSMGTMAGFLMIHEDDRWSRQRCVLILGSDSSQLCKHQMSNPVADSSSQLRDYIRYGLLWSLPEVSQIRRVLCGHARDPQGPKLASCWACLPLSVVRSESKSAAGRHHVLLRPPRAS